MPTFAANIKHRAWGGVKDMDYGNGVHHHLNFNARLLATNSALSNFANNATMTWNYDYYADGQLWHADDVADNHFNRAYAYDQLGRLAEAYSGLEAHGGSYPAGTTPDSPYRQTYTYDVSGHTLSQTGRIWWRHLTGDTLAYSNNRVPGWTYDVAGQVLFDFRRENTYDAAGQRTLVTDPYHVVGGGLTGHPSASAHEATTSYDGDARPARNVSINRSEEYIGGGPQTNITEVVTTVNYLRSSVLGGYVVAELDAQGQQTKAYVYAGGQRLAEQVITPYYNTITYQHKNPLTESWVELDPAQSATRRETDARGVEVGASAPVQLPSEPPLPTERQTYYVIEGGPTDEVKLGMAEHEWFMNNARYGNGYGPGEGNWGLVHDFELNFWFNSMVAHNGGGVSQPGGFGADGLAGDITEWLDSWAPDTWDEGSSTLTAHSTGHFARAGGQSQNRVPLSGELNRKVNEGYKALGVLLDSDSISADCQQNVFDKLKTAVLKDGIRPGEDFTFSFDAGAFTNYVAAGGNFYDGVASQIDSFVSGEHRSSARTFGYADGLTAYFDPARIKDATTSDLFALLFHEALHGFGDNRQRLSQANKTYADGRLQLAFFGFTDKYTDNITKYIQQHCFPDKK